MVRVVSRDSLHVTSLVFLLSLPSLLPTASAQIGVSKQDVTTAAAYPLQKKCAQQCLVYDTGGSCPRDVLGVAIGCSQWKCDKKEWSLNDCYCRQDLQNPAQEFITSCVRSACDVGDVALDASTAGSIYSQYCKDKGYAAPTEPAKVDASATRDSGAQVQTTGAFAKATGSSTASSGSSGSSNKLPITTIIGIVIGSIIALIFAGIGLRMLLRCMRSRTPKPPPQTFQQPAQPPPSYQPPIYPMKPFPEQTWYPPPPESELTPDDSMSVVSGTAPSMPAFPPMAPSLLSGEHTTQQPPHQYHYGR